MEHSFYTILPTQPVLRDWIASVMVIDWDASCHTIEPVYSYPWSATVHLFFTLESEPSLMSPESRLNYPTNCLTGPKLVHETSSLGKRRKVIGIAFKPGGIKRILKVPVSELVNARLDAYLIWGSEINRLSDRLMNAKNNQEIGGIIEAFLLQQLTDTNPLSPFDKAIDELVMRNGNISIATVANHAAMSLRQLERMAQLKLGISPKLFAKITRFTKASMYREAHPNMLWSQIAYEFGYADQMHLIRDFKIFSGSAPSSMDRHIRETQVKLITTIEGKL